MAIREDRIKQRQNSIVQSAAAAIERRPQDTAAILHEVYEVAWRDYEKAFFQSAERVSGNEVRVSRRVIQDEEIDPGFFESQKKKGKT